MPTLQERQKKLQRFAKLPRLTAASAPASPTPAALDTAARNLAGRLKKAGETANIQVRLVAAGKPTDWTVSVADDKAGARRGAAKKPDLRILVSEEEGWDLARGKVSPVEVFLKGRMRIVGDCDLAKRLYRKLAGRGETDI